MDADPFRSDPAAADRPAAPDGSSPSVLVVDDSRFVRASLTRALASRFRIRQADSGERAWELLMLDPSIGALVSDLGMPGMDGFELLRRVRGSLLERVRTLPFAVVSGTDDPAQRDRAAGLGADRYVVKGESVDALGDWLASRLVPDDVRRWFVLATGGPVPDGDALRALLRVHAPGLEGLPARLRRGVRAAQALHVDGVDTAWLCVPASGPLALRLALRFGLLAAGRLAFASGPSAAAVSVVLRGVDPACPGEALAALRALAPEPASQTGLALHALAGPWGPEWRCSLPWPAVRMLAA